MVLNAWMICTMNSYERNGSGTMVTSTLMGIGIAIFDRGFSTAEMTSLYLSGLGPLYFCAALALPWFSDPEMRPFRHMGLLMMAVLQLIIWLIFGGDSIYSCAAFGSVYLVLYILYVISPAVQPFKKTRTGTSGLDAAPSNVTVTFPPTPVYAPSISPSAPVYSQPPVYHAPVHRKY